MESALNLVKKDEIYLLWLLYAADAVLIAENGDMLGMIVNIFVELCRWCKFGVNATKRKGESVFGVRIDGMTLDIQIEFVYLVVGIDKNGRWRIKEEIVLHKWEKFEVQ